MYLKNRCAVLEVGEGLHDILIENFNGFFPVPSKPSNQLLESSFIHLDPVPLAPLQERLNVLDKVDDPTKVWGEGLWMYECEWGGGGN